MGDQNETKGALIRKVPLYVAIAEAVEARRSALERGDGEHYGVWEEKLLYYETELLPSGSGFDSGTRIVRGLSGDKKIVLYTSYHHMVEGMYDGWTEHEVVITPVLGTRRISIRVTGRDRNDIKEYIADTFADALIREVEA